MPKERFNRLPEVKRRVILDAAKKEFARVPFEKASINQIIKNADISRGSFYTYFEDKQDVVRCIFEESRDEMESVCREALKSNQGDYLIMMEHLFEHFISTLQKTTDMLLLVKNVLSYQENQKIFGFNPEAHLSGEDPVLWMMNRINRSVLRFDDVAHFRAMVSMGAAALVMAVKQYYEHPDQLDSVRSEYHTILHLLRCGAYREGCKNQ